MYRECCDIDVKAIVTQVEPLYPLLRNNVINMFPAIYCVFSKLAVFHHIACSLARFLLRVALPIASTLKDWMRPQILSNASKLPTS